MERLVIWPQGKFFLPCFSYFCQAPLENMMSLLVFRAGLGMMSSFKVFLPPSLRLIQIETDFLREFAITKGHLTTGTASLSFQKSWKKGTRYLVRRLKKCITFRYRPITTKP